VRRSRRQSPRSGGPRSTLLGCSEQTLADRRVLAASSQIPTSADHSCRADAKARSRRSAPRGANFSRPSRPRLFDFTAAFALRSSRSAAVISAQWECAACAVTPANDTSYSRWMPKNFARRRLNSIRGATRFGTFVPRWVNPVASHASDHLLPSNCFGSVRLRTDPADRLLVRQAERASSVSCGCPLQASGSRLGRLPEPNYQSPLRDGLPLVAQVSHQGTVTTTSFEQSPESVSHTW
jgi:hypothetical protein